MRQWINIIEKAALADPDFASWFEGSKVVDENGDPLVCYHGTLNTFDEFYSGTHFGDTVAASQRVYDKKKEGYRFGGHHGLVYPVYLSIKNPLRIIDDQGLIDAYDLARASEKVGAITPEEMKSLQAEYPSTRARRRLFALLRERGYDGFVYQNNVEGEADSYVIFDPQQVRYALA